MVTSRIKPCMNAIAGSSKSNQNGENDEKSEEEVSSLLLMDRVIKEGDTVLVRLPSKEIRSIYMKPDIVINFGKFGSFKTNSLFGQPYGLTYEIHGKGVLKVIPPKPIEELDETDATNELITDGQSVQPLTVTEIEQLKLKNARVDDIIKAQIEQHANYSLKTEYSKDKYRKRKEAKFSKSFMTLEPTLFHVAEHWFAKDPGRIRDVRPDALAQMLNFANIHPGGRYLVVDDGGGVVIAGVLERLAGQGRVLVINNTESPPVHFVLTLMNFPGSFTDIMDSINWAFTEEDWDVDYPVEMENDEPQSEKQRSRIDKRKRAREKASQIRNELFAGEWQGLVVSSEYEPYCLVETLQPHLAGSANIVVHSPHLQVLSEMHVKLRAQPEYLAPNVTETWTRQYQMLPGRTHPLMTTSGSAGYILHAIKVYDDPKANAAEPPKKLARLNKRRRLEQNAVSDAGDG